jgi:ADP-heptose:LPS heptosyltransferase
MHISAAVGATTLTLFSCTDPRLHSPYSDKSYFFNAELPCQFCYEEGRKDLCHDYKCLQQIDEQLIISLMEDILDDSADERYHFALN